MYEFQCDVCGRDLRGASRAEVCYVRAYYGAGGKEYLAEVCADDCSAVAFAAIRNALAGLREDAPEGSA